MNFTKEGRDRAKKQLEVSQCYKRIFQSDDGELILEDMFRNFNMMSSTYGSKERDEIVFKEGQRNVILYILSKLNMDEERLQNLIKQANDR